MQVQIGGVYRHYKNKLYKVHQVARCSETLRELVVYECLYENPQGQIWSRPLTEFLGFLEVEGQRVQRFTLT